MRDSRSPAVRRPLCDTRASVLAAWFISTVAVWPILTIVVSVIGMSIVAIAVELLCPDFASQGGSGDLIGMVVGPPLVLVSAVAAAIASFGICRSITVPLKESKPVAFEPVTALAVLFVLLLWVAILAWISSRVG